MNNLWLKLKVWTKITLVTLALVYVISFSVKNSEPQAKATFWYLYGTPELETSTFKLVAGSFVAGILITLLARTTFRTLGQIRELRARQRIEAEEREVEQIRTKAAMLRERPHGESVDPLTGADAPTAEK